jgi:hypothetical protein
MRASQRGPTKPKEAAPPVWRGIGCLLILIVPVLAWILASLTVQLAMEARVQLPYQLMGYAVMPALLWQVPALIPALHFIETQPHLYMTLLVAILFVIALSALLSVTYAIAYRFVGPSRLGPYDEPQPRMKVGRYKR